MDQKLPSAPIVSVQGVPPEEDFYKKGYRRHVDAKRKEVGGGEYIYETHLNVAKSTEFVKDFMSEQGFTEIHMNPENELLFCSQYGSCYLSFVKPLHGKSELRVHIRVSDHTKKLKPQEKIEDFSFGRWFSFEESIHEESGTINQEMSVDIDGHGMTPTQFVAEMKTITSMFKKGGKVKQGELVDSHKGYGYELFFNWDTRVYTVVKGGNVVYSAKDTEKVAKKWLELTGRKLTCFLTYEIKFTANKEKIQVMKDLQDELGDYLHSNKIGYYDGWGHAIGTEWEDEFWYIRADQQKEIKDKIESLIKKYDAADVVRIQSVCKLLFDLKPRDKKLIKSKGGRVELAEHKETLEKLISGQYSVKEGAEMIAQDHIREIPDYYDWLEAMESAATETTAVCMQKGGMVSYGDFNELYNDIILQYFYETGQIVMMEDLYKFGYCYFCGSQIFELRRVNFIDPRYKVEKIL